MLLCFSLGIPPAISLAQNLKFLCRTMLFVCGARLAGRAAVLPHLLYLVTYIVFLLYRGDLFLGGF